MKFASVCSGIEAPSVAWPEWRAAFFSEIEPFPCAVLKHHYPDVPNLGDMNLYGEWPDYAVDVLIGGTPCQAFSVAGLRKGLADPRGNLTLVFLGVVERYRPRWVVWENVPGVLSDATGAFGALLHVLGQLGYGFAYRILDAQYFGVAQRRRRVFVVGHIGGCWQRAAAVLFERESLCGHPAPSREAGKRVAPTLEGRAGRSGANNFATCQNLVAHSLKADGFDASEDGTGRGTPLVAFTAKDSGGDASGISPTLRGGGHSKSHANGGVIPAIAFAQNQRDEVRELGVAGSVRTKAPGSVENSSTTVALSKTGVRRLTPRECERLQGFPDDYTLIPYRGKPAKDGPRYKAIGNSMAVPVIRWIGKRIELVDSLTIEHPPA